jgi:hypothetical protein
LRRDPALRLPVFFRLRPFCAMERFIEDIPRFAVLAAPRAADFAPRVAVRAAPRAVAVALRELERRFRLAEADFDRLDAARPLLFFRDPLVFFREPLDAVERRVGGVVRVPPGSTFTARRARSAIVPAAVVTADPTVLAAVPTPEATVSSTPPLLSSAIIPPWKPAPPHAVVGAHAFNSTVAPPCAPRAWYASFYPKRRRGVR